MYLWRSYSDEGLQLPAQEKFRKRLFTGGGVTRRDDACAGKAPPKKSLEVPDRSTFGCQLPGQLTRGQEIAPSSRSALAHAYEREREHCGEACNRYNGSLLIEPGPHQESSIHRTVWVGVASAAKVWGAYRLLPRTGSDRDPRERAAQRCQRRRIVGSRLA